MSDFASRSRTVSRITLSREELRRVVLGDNEKGWNAWTEKCGVNPAYRESNGTPAGRSFANTTTLPGSPERAEIYRQRAKRGVPIINEYDAKSFDELTNPEHHTNVPATNLRVRVEPSAVQ